MTKFVNILSLLFALFVSIIAQPSYYVLDFYPNVFEPEGRTTATDINDANDIAGNIYVQHRPGEYYPRAYKWFFSGNEIAVLGDATSFDSSQVKKLGPSGELIGTRSVGGFLTSYLWHPPFTEASTIEAPPGRTGFLVPLSINGYGTILGRSAFEAYIYAGGIHVPIPFTGPDPRFDASDINEAHQIAGRFSPVSGLTLATIYDIERGYLLLPLPPFYNSVVVKGLNNLGDVAGGVQLGSSPAPAVWIDGRVLLAKRLGSFSVSFFASDINDSRIAVGNSGDRAFVWKDGVTYDLNNCIAPGSDDWETLIEANAINNYGWIVGTGRQRMSSGQVQSRAFLAIQANEF